MVMLPTPPPPPSVLPRPRWQERPAGLATEWAAPTPGLRSPLQLTKAPSVLLNRKVGRVGVPGQGLSLLQWDSVLNLRSQLPSLIS